MFSTMPSADLQRFSICSTQSLHVFSAVFNTFILDLNLSSIAVRSAFIYFVPFNWSIKLGLVLLEALIILFYDFPDVSNCHIDIVHILQTVTAHENNHRIGSNNSHAVLVKARTFCCSMKRFAANSRADDASFATNCWFTLSTIRHSAKVTIISITSILNNIICYCWQINMVKSC